MKSALCVLFAITFVLCAIQCRRSRMASVSISEAIVFVYEVIDDVISSLLGGVLDPLDFLLDGLVRRIKRVVILGEVRNFVNSELNNAKESSRDVEEFLITLITLLISVLQDMITLLVRSLTKLSGLQNNTLEKTLTPSVILLTKIKEELNKSLDGITADVKAINLPNTTLRRLDKCLSKIDDVVNAFLNGSVGILLGRVVWEVIELGKVFYLQKTTDFNGEVNKLQDAINRMSIAVKRLSADVATNAKYLATCLQSHNVIMSA